MRTRSRFPAFFNSRRSNELSASISVRCRLIARCSGGVPRCSCEGRTLGAARGAMSRLAGLLSGLLSSRCSAAY
eukprot:5864134-Pleurochrysis_carterae.AAC.1